MFDPIGFEPSFEHQRRNLEASQQTINPAHRLQASKEKRGLIEQAHSDSLQLLVTGGVVGAALGVLVIGALLVILVLAWRGQPHREESALVLAGFGAGLTWGSAVFRW